MRVLIVDDRIGDSSELKKLLSQKVANVEVELATKLLPAIEMASKFKPELVVLDAELPDSGAFETIARIPEFIKHGAAVVVISGYDEEALAIATFANGGEDFIIKASSVNIVQRLIFAKFRRKYAYLRYAPSQP